MEAANQSSPTPTLRRLPFSIRFAPQFIEQLSALLSDNQHASGRVAGLLFGQLKADSIFVQTFRPLASFQNGNEAWDADGTTKNWHEIVVARGKKDPELSALTLTGWFSVRNEFGLQAEDIVFQQKNFPAPTDVALIVKNEQKGKFTLELWYGPTLDGSASGEGQHRAVRLSGVEPSTTPVEVPIRSTIHEDLYMRAYELSDAQDGSPHRWKQALSKTKKVFGRFKPTNLGEKSSGHALDGHENSGSNIFSLRPVTHAAQPVPSGGSAFASASISQPFPGNVTDASAEIPQPGPSGTATAPARIPQPQVSKAEEQASTTQAEHQDVRSQSETPASVVTEKQRPSFPHRDDVVLVRSEEREVPGGDQTGFGAIPAFAPPEPVYPEPKPVVAPAGLSQPKFATELTRPPAKTVRELPWRAMVAVFALAAAVTFGFIYIKGAGANGKLPGFLQVFWPSPALDLKIASSGERFQLSWNRSIPAVQTATEATLDIKDGSNHRQIVLGGAELAHGSVLYFPSTDNVVFRLDVRGAAGQYLSESLRVMGTTHSPALQVSKPADERPAPLPASARHSTVRDRAPVNQTALESARRISPIPATEQSAKPATEQSPKQDVDAKNGVQTQAADLPVVAPPDGQTQIAKASAPDKPAIETPKPEASSAITGAETTQNTSQPSPPPQDEAVRPSSERVAPASAPQSLKTENVIQSAPIAGPNRQETEAVSGNAPSPQPASAPARGGSTGQSGALLSFRPPRPIKQVLPKLGMLPAGTAEPGGELKVAVRVDESGHVVNARVIEGQRKVTSILSAAALSAAKQWVFEPASLHGKNVASDHTILFRFRR